MSIYRDTGFSDQTIDDLIADKMGESTIKLSAPKLLALLSFIMVNVFAVPVFFICFRESLECAIIVSVLLSFLKRTIGPERDAAIYKKLVRQIWFGVILGVAICVAIGAGMIGAWYGVGKNHFATTEDIWEGTFALLASLIISFMGIGLLRVSKMTEKWRVKIALVLDKHQQKANLGTRKRFDLWCQRYMMVLLPLVTVLREGLEAVVFIGGVALGLPASAFPIAVLSGLGAGSLIGWLMYKTGNNTQLQIFLIISTCFLYLIAAGLFSKAVWFFENYEWSKFVGGDASETGSGPGSYDIRESVWHVNCCNPKINGGGGWGVFNSIFGWQNSATYGTVLAYNLYWLVVIVAFVSLGFYEKYGHWPMIKKSKSSTIGDSSSGGGKSDGASGEGIVESLETKTADDILPTTATSREV